VTAPTWTILVPTIPQREHLFLRLLDVLLPQLDEHEGRVRVLAWRNQGDPRLAEIRDAMVDSAGTDYVSFIDDDDLVPEYYVAEIVRALAETPDHVGFRMHYSSSETDHEIVEHSLRWSKWGRSVDGLLYRDFTHVDPVRTELAQKGRFAVARPRRAEDRVWVRQVRPWLSSEVFLDKIMYYYEYRAATSSWQNLPPLDGPAGPRPEPGHPYFAWHPLSDS
jgi:hypothetical protein